MPTMTMEAMQEEINRLRAERDAAQAAAEVAARRAATTCSPLGNAMSAKVAPSGGVSVYGLGRWPTTLYKKQWLRLLSVADSIRAFISTHDAMLPDK